MTLSKKHSNKLNTDRKPGAFYLILALIMLGVICLEFVWAYALEPAVFHVSVDSYTAGQMIFHWILTCISWGCAAIFILYIAKKNIGFSLFHTNNIFSFTLKTRLLCIIALIGCVVFSLSISYVSWNGCKVFIEFRNLGIAQFIFQYIYYAFETFLFFLIIVFAQKTFEAWFGHAYFPYGGVIVALTWGLGHILSKGSVSTGIIAAIDGFVYGIIYLLTNRDAKTSYILLFICFIL